MARRRVLGFTKIGWELKNYNPDAWLSLGRLRPSLHSHALPPASLFTESINKR